MQNAGYNTYSSMQKEGLSGRALEAQILTRAANMLKDCQSRWGVQGQEERLDDSVKFNQKVWTFFQAELTDPENPLPRELKQNLLNLSLFIDRQLLEFLLNPNPETLTSVININLNIAAGLMERPKTETTASPVEPGNFAMSV